MVKKYNYKDKGFYAFYPVPRDLTAPVDFRPEHYPFDYDVFANHHITVNGMSLCIRRCPSFFAVSVRGWLPKSYERLQLRYDKGWTNVVEAPSFPLCLTQFKNIAIELLTMSDDSKLAFQPLSVVSYSSRL